MEKETADKYQEFFNFMSQEHDLILTIEEMDEIVFEAQRLIEKLTLPAVEQSEQLCDNPNCEDGIVDYDYYKNPIYCQVCAERDVRGW